eukprot:jgi/Ulvmu1/185/UM001_0189.1
MNGHRPAGGRQLNSYVRTIHKELHLARPQALRETCSSSLLHCRLSSVLARRALPDMTVHTITQQETLSDVTPEFVPHLKDICVQAVADQFQRSTLTNVSDKFHSAVVDKLSLDLPLELAGTAIADEAYWKHRSQGRWSNCDAKKHGGSFKQLYFERNLQDTIEEFDIEADNLEDLKRLVAFSARYVQNLLLEQLPSHLNLEIIFDGLGNSLTTLALRYGMRAVGMDYDRALFGIKLSDCRSLARCLEFCETLVALDLRGALLDDDKLRMLASGLINNVSVVHLDLSANRIADRGVRALAKLLHPNSIIQFVNLSNNQIHVEGGRALARALRTNTALCYLNLRLNRLGDEGGRAVVDAVRQHPRLEQLDLGHNGLAALAAKALGKCLPLNGVLRCVELLGNELGEAGGATVRAAVEAASALEVCSLARCGLAEADLLAVQDVMATRAETAARRRILNSASR